MNMLEGAVLYSGECALSSADGVANVELWSMEEGIPHSPLFFRVGANGIKVLAEKKLEVSTES